MVSVDWLEGLWQNPQNGNEFNLCGISLESIKREENKVEKKVGNETRDSPNTRYSPERRDRCEDDDSSVVSSSGVSVLSIDYENNEVAAEQVDFSDIGDDESTVVSYDSRSHNVDEDAEVDAIKKNLKTNAKESISREDSKESISRVDLMKNKKLESSKISGNPAAEEQRKQLLVSLRNNISTHGRHSVQVAAMITRLAQFHEEINQLEMSLTLNMEALNIYSCRLGDSDEKVTDAQVRIGRLKEKLDDHDSALDYYCRALFMITAMTGLYEEKTAIVRLHVARMYQVKGFHKESVKELKKSLRAFRDTHGDEHVTVANTVDKIADAYTQGGSHDKANGVRGELVKLKVALFGSKCSEVAHALHKLASTFSSGGDPLGALKVMKQAYVMFHEVEGPEAMNTELVLEQIGFLYSQTDREEKAVKAHTSVAVMRKKRNGEDSIEVAISYLTLGKSFLNCSQYEKAFRSLNRALTIFGRANESDNAHVENLMDTLHHIGVVHRSMANPDMALKTFTRELSIRRKFIPDDRASIASTLAATGGAYFDLKKYDLAKQNYIQSLQLIEKVEGRRLHFAEVLLSCAKAIEKANDQTASIYFLEALQIYKANGCSENEEFMEDIMAQMPSSSQSQKIEPSLKCSLLDKSKTNGSKRFEI